MQTAASSQSAPFSKEIATLAAQLLPSRSGLTGGIDRRNRAALKRSPDRQVSFLEIVVIGNGAVPNRVGLRFRNVPTVFSADRLGNDGG